MNTDYSIAQATASAKQLWEAVFPHKPWPDITVMWNKHFTKSWAYTTINWTCKRKVSLSNGRGRVAAGSRTNPRPQSISLSYKLFVSECDEYHGKREEIVHVLIHEFVHVAYPYKKHSYLFDAVVYLLERKLKGE